MKLLNIDHLPWIFIFIPFLILGTDFILTNYALILLNNGYLVNFFIEIIGSGLGVGGALWLYVIQRRQERKVENQKKERAESELLLYCKNQIENAKDWINTQIELIEEFCKNIETNPFLFTRIYFDPSQSFLRLEKTFEKTNFYHAYLNKFGSTNEMIEKFNKIEDCIDYFVNVREQLSSMRSEAISKYIARTQKIKEFIRDTIETALSLIKKYEGSDKDGFAQALIASFDAMKDIDKTDFRAYIEDIFLPLKHQLVPKYLDIDEAEDVVNNIDRLSIELDEIRINMNSHKDEYREVIRYFQKMRDKFNNSTFEFEGFGMTDERGS